MSPHEVDMSGKRKTKKLKEKYCRYCGRELEFGVCICDEFLASQDKKEAQLGTFKCDTCGNEVSSDSIYCSHCGMPLLVDGNIKELQQELRGDNAKDVIKVYEKEMKPRGRFLFPLSYVISVAVLSLFVGALFGYIVVPEIKRAIFNYNFSRQAQLDSMQDESLDMEGMMEEGKVSEDIDYDAETEPTDFGEGAPVVREIEEPTAKTETSTVYRMVEEGTSRIEETTEDEEEGGDNSKKTEGDENETEETEKKITLYLEKGTRIDDAVSSGGNTCQIIYYLPTVGGDDAAEALLLNEMYKYTFSTDFITQVKNYALESEDLPISIVFDMPKETGGTTKNYRLKYKGVVTPRNGLVSSINFTVIYNRSDNTLVVRRSS